MNQKGNDPLWEEVRSSQVYKTLKDVGLPLAGKLADGLGKAAQGLDQAINSPGSSSRPNGPYRPFGGPQPGGQQPGGPQQSGSTGPTVQQPTGQQTRSSQGNGSQAAGGQTAGPAASRPRLATATITTAIPKGSRSSLPSPSLSRPVRLRRPLSRRGRPSARPQPIGQRQPDKQRGSRLRPPGRR